MIVRHPDYDSVSNDNDVALVRLSAPVRYTAYIKPVCLAASSSVFVTNTNSWVTGWGLVQEGGEEFWTILHSNVLNLITLYALLLFIMITFFNKCQ